MDVPVTAALIQATGVVAAALASMDQWRPRARAAAAISAPNVSIW